MKSKLIISSIVLAILVSFAFISIDEHQTEKKDQKILVQKLPGDGITLEDNNF